MATENHDVYTVRVMQPHEVEDTYHMVDKEGWNLTLDKFSTLYKFNPEYFFVTVTNAGEVVGTMSLYPTFQGEYVLGNIVIKDGHRSKSLGRKLMDDVFALHPGAVVSLTAVPGADQFYLKTGFMFTQPQQGHDIFHLILDRNDLERRSIEMGGHNVEVQPYEESLFNDIVAYDHEARGYKQTSYVAMQVKCFKMIVARNPGGSVVGFGVAFIKCEEIVLDGLYADSDAIALQLIMKILMHFPDRNTMKIQIPSSKLFLSQLGQVKSSYKYNRYSIGQPTESPLSKVYNVGDCDYTY